MRLGATLAHLSPAPPYPVAEWARRLVGAVVLIEPGGPDPDEVRALLPR